MTESKKLLLALTDYGYSSVRQGETESKDDGIDILRISPPNVNKITNLCATEHLREKTGQTKCPD